jgi:hypothetical protein
MLRLLPLDSPFSKKRCFSRPLGRQSYTFVVRVEATEENTVLSPVAR